MFIRLCMQLITFTFYEDFQKHSLNFLLFRQLKVQLTRVEGFYIKWIWPVPHIVLPRLAVTSTGYFVVIVLGKIVFPIAFSRYDDQLGAWRGKYESFIFKIGSIIQCLWKEIGWPLLKIWLASGRIHWDLKMHFLSVAIQSSLQQYVGLFSSLWLLILLGIPEILNNST